MPARCLRSGNRPAACWPRQQSTRFTAGGTSALRRKSVVLARHVSQLHCLAVRSITLPLSSSCFDSRRCWSWRWRSCWRSRSFSRTRTSRSACKSIIAAGLDFARQGLALPVQVPPPRPATPRRNWSASTSRSSSTAPGPAARRHCSCNRRCSLPSRASCACEVPRRPAATRPAGGGTGCARPGGAAAASPVENGTRAWSSHLPTRWRYFRYSSSNPSRAAASVEGCSTGCRR